MPPERLAGYHKLIREAQVAADEDRRAPAGEEERKWKTISKAAKDYYKLTGRA